MTDKIPYDEIDEDIRPLVRILNEEDIVTFASCSGHGKKNPWIKGLRMVGFGLIAFTIGYLLDFFF